jgi:hypothetical protein
LRSFVIGNLHNVTAEGCRSQDDSLCPPVNFAFIVHVDGPRQFRTALDGSVRPGESGEPTSRAATGLGAKVKAEAVMETFDGRFYAMRVRAW